MAGFYLLLVSLVLVVEGVALILMPKKCVKAAHGVLSKAKEPKLLGIVPLLAGVFLLLSISSSVLGWLVLILGLAMIAKAVYVFRVPVAKIRNSRWLGLSDNSYRILGILVLVLGIILFISRI